MRVSSRAALVGGVIAAAVLSGPAAPALAAPHCTWPDPDPAPACGGGPAPVSTSLSSLPIYPRSDTGASFRVRVLGADPDLLNRYSAGDSTPYSVRITCTNGLSIKGSLKVALWPGYRDPREQKYLSFDSVPLAAGVASGVCTVTASDKDALGLTTVVFVDPGSVVNSWWVVFS